MVRHQVQLRRSFLEPGAKIISALLLIVAAGVVSVGQMPSAQLEQMKKLDFLEGEWKGKGWMYHLDGTRSAEISQSTKVKRTNNGLSFRIKDKKKYPDLQIAGGAFPGMILNYPMQMPAESELYYDEGSQRYHWRPDTPAGHKNPFPAMLVAEKTLKVKLEFTGSLAVVTIEVTDAGEWHETLEIWMDRKGTWFKLQETFLKKSE